MTFCQTLVGDSLLAHQRSQGGSLQGWNCGRASHEVDGREGARTMRDDMQKEHHVLIQAV